MFCFSLWNIFHIRTIIVGGGPINLFQGVFLFFKKRVTSCLIGFVVENDFEINRNYTRAPWTFFFSFCLSFCDIKGDSKCFTSKEKWRMQVWGVFFIFFPPKKWGEKKDEGCPPASEFRCYYYLKKKKCGEGGRKRWKSNTWKNQWKKCPSYVVLKQNQKKNWFKEIKHTRMFILLNKPLNKETGWHLTTASQKNKFSILFFFFILPFFYDCGCIRGAF